MAIQLPEIVQRIRVDDRDLDRAEGRFGGMAGRLGKIGGGIATAAGAALAAVGAVGAGAVGWGVKVAADQQQVAIAFETTLGSAQAAKSMMEDLEAFAARTPFELPSLQTAATRLTAVGVEAGSVIPLMEALGDSTAAMGTGAEGIDRAVTALTQMQQKGKVTGEEMLQLTEAGIPAWETLAATLGTDVAGAQELVSSGAVKAGDLMAGIADRAGPAMQRLEGMMEKQAGTLSGLWSTFTDTVQMELAGIAAPLVTELTGILPDVTDAVGRLLQGIGPPIADALGSIVGLFASLLPAIEPVLAVFGEVIAEVADALVPVFEGLAPVIGDLGGAMGELLLALVPLIPPFGELIVALAPLLPVMAELITLVVTGLVPVLTPLISGVAKLVTWLFESKGALLAVGAAFLLLGAPNAIVVGLIAGLVKVFVENWDTIRETTVAVFGAIGRFLARTWQAITRTVTGALRAIGRFLRSTWSAITGAVRSTWSAITGVIRGAWNVITGAIRGAMATVRSVIQGAWAAVLGVVRGAVDGVVRLIRGLLSAYVGILRTIGSTIRDGFRAAWNMARDAVAGGIEAVLGFVRGVPGRVLSAIGNLGSLLHGAGRAIFDGLLRGLASMAGRIGEAVLAPIRRAKERALSFLRIGSPSRLFMGIGEDTGLGFAIGVEDQQDRAAKAATRLAAAASGALDPLALATGQAAGRVGRGLPARGAPAAPASPAGPTQTVHIGKVEARDPQQAARELDSELGWQYRRLVSVRG